MKSIVCILVLAIVAVHSIPLADQDRLDETQSVGRIRNGLKAQADQFPFHVSITSSSPATQSLYVCSGSLLSMQWVLTAASCTIRHHRFDLRFNAVQFYTGGDSLTSHTAFPHPGYNPITRELDAALISLPRTLQANQFGLRPIAIPSVGQISSNVDFANIFARTTGFGRIGEFQSPILQFENLRVIENRDNLCRNALVANNITGSTQQSILCASQVHHPAQTNNCTGDIGSPIFIIENNNRILQIGISLFDADHRRCVGSTSLYTRMTDVSRWIRTLVPNI